VDPNSIAVIILNWNKADLAISCLMNIKAVGKDVSKRIIIIDNGSNNSTTSAGAKVKMAISIAS